jgi:hypothetical protein
VIKGALVGYKVVDVSFCCLDKPYIRTIYFNHKVKKGWNTNKSTQKKIVVKKSDDVEKGFSYPNGFHVYTSFKTANEGSHIYYVIPVHFFPKDIVAEGKEGFNVIFGKKVDKSVVVVSKYFVSKDDYEKSINKAKKDLGF